MLKNRHEIEEIIKYIAPKRDKKALEVNVTLFHECQKPSLRKMTEGKNPLSQDDIEELLHVIYVMGIQAGLSLISELNHAGRSDIYKDPKIANIGQLVQAILKYKKLS
jgi:hypothetical protein